MGLDMYLEGKSYLWHNPDQPPLLRAGFRVKRVTLDLGYWRKHPDLHGYIVQNFADGVDECQEIPLTAENIKLIILAIKERELPKTDGFFFGQSDGSEDTESIEILERALDWLELKDKSESREVFYRASW